MNIVVEVTRFTVATEALPTMCRSHTASYANKVPNVARKHSTWNVSRCRLSTRLLTVKSRAERLRLRRIIKSTATLADIPAKIIIQISGCLLGITGASLHTW